LSRRLALVKRALLALPLVAALVGLAGVARAEAPASVAVPAYRISVLTMGPGDSFVTLFGHDALLVERAGLPPLVYNFGMYTEAAIAPHHVLGGTLRYYLEASTLARTLPLYSAQNREMVRQVLALEPAVAEKLARALSVNTLPENATYAYDFARDNCTTRVRDAIDGALDGALRRALAGPAALTYRDHALRFTAGDWPLYFLFDLALGVRVDRPLTAWDDAYLPDRLMTALRTVRLPAPDGSRPLVASEGVLVRAERPPLRQAPPLRAPFHALAGVALGVGLWRLGRQQPRFSRVFFGLASAGVGLVLGLLGLWVLLLLGTKVHVATHANYNVLVCPPLALLLVVPGLKLALGRVTAAPRLARYALLGVVVSALGWLLATVMGQQSYRVALLCLPLLSGVWQGARAAPRTA
jgi:uncharacterized protein DUF4105